MKILIVVPNTNIGGVTTSAVNFSCELSRRGHDVYFLDMSGEHLCSDRLDEKIIRLSLKGRSRLWNIGIGKVKKAKGFRKLGLLICGAVKKITIKSGLWHRIVFSKFSECGDFDVAVAFRQCAPCYSFVLNKVKSTKKIGFIHGELKYMSETSSWDKYFKCFDRVACVSNAVRKEFEVAFAHVSDRFVTVYNMFDVEKIKSMSNENAQVVFNHDVINIVTVARIDNTFKQTDWIPAVCEKLKLSTSTPFHWYVVGDGPDYWYTVELAKSKNVNDVLTFLGKIENPYPIIKESDFTVLTSKSEAYPMVVIESIILGRPVIATEFSSVYEMISTGCHGYISKQDKSVLCDIISSMINNDSDAMAKCCEFLQEFNFTNDLPYSQFMESIGGV